MKNSAFENFSEDAQNVLDYARCQRSDGSFYGTSGQCRKGSPTGAKEKAAKSVSKGGDKPSRAEDKAQLKATAARNKAERERTSGRAKNEQLNKDLRSVTQDGPKPTPKQRVGAMKRLQSERNRLENLEDEGKLGKVGQARLKLVKAAQREWAKG